MHKKFPDVLFYTLFQHRSFVEAWVNTSPEKSWELEVDAICSRQQTFFFCLAHWKVFITPKKSLISIVKAKIKNSFF